MLSANKSKKKLIFYINILFISIYLNFLSERKKITLLEIVCVFFLPRISIFEEHCRFEIEMLMNKMV